MKKLFWTGGLLAALTTVYVAGVATLIFYANYIFGKMNNIIGPIAFLMLFVVSALITGALLLGKPLMMYLDGKKKEAVKLFGFNVLWIVIFAIIAFVINLFI